MADYAEPRPGIITLPLLDATTCERIIALAHERDEWRQAGVVEKKSGHGQVMTRVRSAALSPFGEGTEVWTLLHARIDAVVRPLVKTRWARDFPVHSEFQVVRYDPGDFYHTHRDSGPHLADRYFSVVCYLNDDFDGGGTHFPGAAYTVDPVKGHALIFPSDYLHRAERIIEGTKHIAVTWLLGAPPVQWI